MTSTVLDEETAITLADICNANNIAAEELMALIEEGLLQPAEHLPEVYFFGPTLPRLRMAL